jgi:transposase
MRTRRTFTREFKREAAYLVLDQGYSVRDVCTQLDLQEGALRRWVQQVRFERNGGVRETAALTPEQQEIQALKARISKLEREKTTLKKATALLVAEEIDRSL